MAGKAFHQFGIQRLSEAGVRHAGRKPMVPGQACRIEPRPNGQDRHILTFAEESALADLQLTVLARRVLP